MPPKRLVSEEAWLVEGPQREHDNGERMHEGHDVDVPIGPYETGGDAHYKGKHIHGQTLYESHIELPEEE